VARGHQRGVRRSVHEIRKPHAKGPLDYGKNQRSRHTEHDHSVCGVQRSQHSPRGRHDRITVRQARVGDCRVVLRGSEISKVFADHEYHRPHGDLLSWSENHIGRRSRASDAQRGSVNWQFAFPLPDAIASEHAGPLMCAGATVFTPILQYGVRPTDRVAVVGVGGLGHLAVQYLAKWGCDVTAVSSSRDKEAHARGLGATHYIATRGNGRAAEGRALVRCHPLHGAERLAVGRVHRGTASAGEAVPHRSSGQAGRIPRIRPDRRREVDRRRSDRIGE
jgi:hypothetical protein